MGLVHGCNSWVHARLSVFGYRMNVGVNDRKHVYHGKPSSIRCARQDIRYFLRDFLTMTFFLHVDAAARALLPHHDPWKQTQIHGADVSEGRARLLALLHRQNRVETFSRNRNANGPSASDFRVYLVAPLNCRESEF